jgi:hypothetical protein
MPLYDWVIPVIMGGLFVLLGLIAIFWGKSEEKSYYDALSTRRELREFLERQPRRPQPLALKIGGWLAVAVGLLMLAVGGIILLWS